MAGFRERRSRRVCFTQTADRLVADKADVGQGNVVAASRVKQKVEQPSIIAEKCKIEIL